ncbi:NAD-dependent epimerase/dehydratase [Magnetococcus marinus MC-1]|uniref:NAD-dependent epimerase/dehydratase n=1 Tax=Magnetococcus marinus (strain ATCC BAA-1437 / JCM 17883 / MC-1) TaxID=156889 RepID=A0L6A2_MAGMM|nr:complex I NDUFA9 subunit family protein [Magnetococcus marinus]ABK43495.1 NAD-dependent epimerase/dehydratase [Magnetococcus marinus MC-1]
MILITGATGFVGQALIQQLVSEGHKIRALARHIPARHAPEGVQYVAGDIQIPSSLQTAMEGVTCVIHLVGILAEQRHRSFEEIHHQGTLNVLQAAKQAGVKRFLHMSSLGTRANAVARYHQSKWQAECAVRESGLDYTIFRPSVIFGPGDNFVNQFARMIRFSPMVPILGDGQNRMQPIAVGDVARCFAIALTDRQTLGQTYELGGPQQLTFQEIMENILDALHKKRFKLRLPFALLKLEGKIFEVLLSNPPLTYDQMLMAQEHNVCAAGTSLPTPFTFTPLAFAEGIRRYLTP